MKKLFILIIAICLVFAPLPKIVSAQNNESEFALSTQQIDALTQQICTEIPDRTSFTDANLAAAQKIAGIYQDSTEQGGADLVAYSDGTGYLSSQGLNIEIQTFEQTVAVSQGFTRLNKTLYSYNVIATVKNYDASKKTVLITTNFANHYSGNEFLLGVEAEGALYNAATTALTIELANYLSRPGADNQYNYVFAFFSGTDEGNFGSVAFADEYESLNKDVMLVINLERLGCGKTYYYTDEAETTHGKFIDEVAAGYNVKQFPLEGRTLLDFGTVDGLPYSHYAMRGDISTFLSNGKSCLELIGGDFSSLKDGEGNKPYLSSTNIDTYDKLIELHPDYAAKIAEAGQFVIDLTSKSELKDVCLGAATSYKIFAQRWVGYVICLGVIVVLILVMIIVIHKFEKKYPIPPPQKVKIAVFGKEYEDLNGNEIIVDIKRDDSKVKMAVFGKEYEDLHEEPTLEIKNDDTNDVDPFDEK